MQSILSKSIHQVSLIPYTHSKYPAWRSYPNTPQSQEAISNGKKSTKEPTFQTTTPLSGRSGDVSIWFLKPRENVSEHQPRSATSALAACFADVVRLTYSSERDSSLPGRLDTEFRQGAIIETLYVSLLLRSGQVGDEEEASLWARKLIEEHRRLCQDGNSSPSRLMRGVARKRLRSSRLRKEFPC